MDIITEAELRRQIKENPKKGYLLFGEEDYLKAYSLKSFKERLCPDPALEPFNYIKLDGLDLTPDVLIGAITTLPMMSDIKLIEITGVNFKDRTQMSVDEYCSVLELLPEYDYNTVVISVAADCIDEGKPKRPSPSLKKLGEYLTLVQFSRATPLMLSRWAEKHFLANGVRADFAVCSKLVEYCGTDMHRLAAETDKISWYALAKGRDQIEPSDITEVAIADTEYDTYSLTNALTSGNKPEALRVLSNMRHRKMDPILIMGEVTSLMCSMVTVRMLADEGLSASEIVSKTRMHEFRVKLYLRSAAPIARLRDILKLCAEADASVKGLGQGYAPIERLICAL